MNIFWSFVLSSIAGLSTMLGCLGILIPVKKKEEFITFSISLSLSVMIMISVFDLIPSSIKELGNNALLSLIYFIVFFLLGVILTNTLNKLVEKQKESNNLYKLGILSFIVLVMHNLPEGILTFMSTYQDFKLGLSLCLAITLHNIPEGISIAVPIYYATGNIKEALKCTFLSALAEPLGALLAFLIFKNFITKEIISMFLMSYTGSGLLWDADPLWPRDGSRGM